MNRDRTYCESYTCLTKTCSRHRVHLPKWYFLPLVWVDCGEDNCEMYKGRHRWKTLWRTIDFNFDEEETGEEEENDEI